MVFVDTHTHIYQPEFDSDRDEMIQLAIDSGVKYLLLPNIDTESVGRMMSAAAAFRAHCFPMMGLHPSSVKENYREEMKAIGSLVDSGHWYAIGETGIDLYWDTSYTAEQEEVFRTHIDWAIHYKLALVIHSRNSFQEIIRVLDDYKSSDLRGVFHCFPGSSEQAKEVIKRNFYLGIGGVVSFKNAKMARVVADVPLEHIILETDSPYLAPEPFRGKRNQSSYIPLIAQKIASIKNIELEEVARITTENALNLFSLKISNEL